MKTLASSVQDFFEFILFLNLNPKQLQALASATFTYQFKQYFVSIGSLKYKILFWSPLFDVNVDSIHCIKSQKQPTEVFYRKHVLKNFVKFTGKHLHRRLLLKSVCSYLELLCSVFSSIWTEYIRLTQSKSQYSIQILNSIP